MAIKDLTAVSTHLFLCNGGSCARKGAEESTRRIREYLADEGLAETVHTTKTYCNGRCHDGPVVIALPEGKWFKNVVPEQAKRFVKEYLVAQNGCPSLALYHYGDPVIMDETIQLPTE
jgi:(2Fe-2S) ferredoxin